MRREQPAVLHDLRHIHATTLLLAGVRVHVVAARLGHADPSITLRVYAHVINQQLVAAAEIFANEWRMWPSSEALLADPLAKAPLLKIARGL
ncbi:tyrosine-type recombinase/integrase [Actinomadura macra]|uniref:tyrosine-type recombinase/integrase n=1 Tax=Actinomadura macra TaxID=46164 RepID=UPI000830E6BC|nr:tyrosine-type recombinase/integrase [Actinomadura macra]